MKKIRNSVFIFSLILSFSLAVTSTKEKIVTTTNVSAVKVSSVTISTNPMVTFVELGSVNCIPCKMMRPVMQKVEEQYPTQVKVIFHDVWTPEGQPYAEQFKIKVIPTQVFLDSNGKEYYRHQGFFSYEELEKILKQKISD